MQRFLYTLALYFALPFVPLKLIWRGIKQPDYLKHWAERFGFYRLKPKAPVICVHCVSVGETNAAVPLVKALQTNYPDHQVLITHGTPTGRETSTNLFGDQVLRAYLPYDLPFAVKRFLKHFNPSIVILMETEIWFNLINQCQLNSIPAVLINARLSEKSAKGYEKVNTLMTQGLQQLAVVSAQTKDDAQRFARFGIKPVINGNLKFDVTADQAAINDGKALKKSVGDRLIFVAASTREGEEALLIETIKQLNPAEVFCIVVPRHPQRFDTVADLLKAQQLSFVRKSNLSPSASINTNIMLGDTMGELSSYYAAADVAFVGGSLLPLGGQNMIEPCAVGTPVIIGPHTFNFALVSEQLVAAGAAVRVQDNAALTTLLNQLLQNTAKAKAQRDAMQQKGLAFVAQHKGATEKHLAAISPYI